MGSELCSLKNSDNEVQKQETQIDVIYVMLLGKVSLIGFSQTPPPPPLSNCCAWEAGVWHVHHSEWERGWKSQSKLNKGLQALLHCFS